MHDLIRHMQQYLPHAERILPQIGGSIFPVWHAGANGVRRLVGTAFFAYLDERLLLITAEHNFSDNPDKTLCITLNGTVRPLNAMNGLVSRQDDLWVAEADADIKAVMAEVTTPELRRRSSDLLRRSLGVVFMGYPESLNKSLDTPHLLGISTMLETRNLDSTNLMPQPIYNTVNSDYLYDSQGQPQMVTPAMYGMSGGPAFGWYASPGSDCHPDIFHYFLQGVSASWSQSRGYVVACSAARIVALVDTDPDRDDG
ncbi:hypothetical protein GTP38_00570 [Duganella sp. FT94W]|uniref:Trypsin-like peptidase domain-containing protein n=1 Tax=Duganella lactea TaxID=2692173 RepID=A0ABW9V1V3_9BURK|nr:hypothetical protein [Duganella lactea]MYM32844.1 hypothetical protein [Duganella lactea]